MLGLDPTLDMCAGPVGATIKTMQTLARATKYYLGLH
jgi:hypothetical protein